MNAIVPWLDACGGLWLDYVTPAAWQAALVGGILLGMVYGLRRLPSPLRYGLLLVALLKFVTPPLLALPTGLLSQLPLPFVSEPMETVAVWDQVAPTTFAETNLAARRWPMPDGREAVLADEMLPRAAAATERPREEVAAVALPVAERMASRETGAAISWPAVLMLLHGLGVLLVGGWILRTCRSLGRLVRESEAVTAGPLYESFCEASRQVGLRRPVGLRVCRRAVTPMAIGVWRPVVLIPAAMLEQLSPREQQTVMAHELAHHRRGDVWVIWLQAAIVTLWWFHPVVWLLHRALIRVREECCDDLLLGKRITTSGDYCQTLLQVVQWCAARNDFRRDGWLVPTMHPLGRRIQRVMDTRLHRSTRLSIVGALVLAAVAATMLPGLAEPTIAGAETEPEEAVPVVGVAAASPLVKRDGFDLYGDPLPAGVIARLGTVRLRHDGWHTHSRVLAANNAVVTSSGESSVRVWDPETGRVQRELDLGGKQFQAFELSPDGKIIVTLAVARDSVRQESDWELRFWDTASWQTRSVIARTCPLNDEPSCLTFSPDGETIATSNDRGGISFWSVSLGGELLKHSLGIRQTTSLAFSPDFSLLAVASQSGVHLWQWSLGGEPEPLVGLPSHGVEVVAFSPDGKLLATGGTSDEFAAWIWDVETRSVLRRLKGADRRYDAQGLAFSTDGQWLAVPCADARQVELFDVVTGRVARTLNAGRLQPSDAAISSDGKLLASVGYGGTIKIWKLPEGEHLADRFLGHEDHVLQVAFTPDGAHIVSGSLDGTIRIWDAETGRQLRLLEHEQCWGIALSPDGKQLVSCGYDDSVRLWDVASGRLLYRLYGHGRGGMTKSSFVKFASQEHWFLTFGSDLNQRIWSADSGRLLQEHAIRPDGMTIREAEDGSLMRDPDPFGIGPEAAIRDAHFTDDGTRLMLQVDNSIRSFDTQTGQEIGSVQIDDVLEGIAVSPDGKTLVTTEVERTAPETDPRVRKQYVRFRDCVSKQIDREIALGAGYAYPCVFSPDGRLLATQIHLDPLKPLDGFAFVVWDADTGQEYARIGGITRQPWKIAISHDCRRLAAGFQDTTILVWDLEQFRTDNIQWKEATP